MMLNVPYTGQTFTFAFQPIVDTSSSQVFSYEALIRGRNGEPANHVLSIPVANIGTFDQMVCGQAIELAATLGLRCRLNLNVRPSSIYSAANSMLQAIQLASGDRVPLRHLILELTEEVVIRDPVGFAEHINIFRSFGINFALDDFGAGYSGLNLLADFQPDQIKLDTNLVRSIESRGPRQAIVRAICQACWDLGIDVIAEGVESHGEYFWLLGQGIHLFQGYFFGQPGFESLPTVPELERYAFALPLDGFEELRSRGQSVDSAF